jgi:hypothetical protein
MKMGFTALGYLVTMTFRTAHGLRLPADSPEQAQETRKIVATVSFGPSRGSSTRWRETTGLAECRRSGPALPSSVDAAAVLVVMVELGPRRAGRCGVSLEGVHMAVAATDEDRAVARNRG